MRLHDETLALAIAALAIGCGNGAGNGTVQFAVSGEVLALGGYAFPPASPMDAAFSDGWELRFSKLLVVFDKVTLSQNPDTAPTDQSQVGKLVAEIDGPWVADLHQGGPLIGKGGGGEQALPIAMIKSQNRNGGAGFDPTVRYAFGFDAVAATNSAIKLNVDANDPDWAEMVAKGWSVLYVGTATWKGDQGGSSCTTTASYDFTRLPRTVSFRLGFATPTTYINCQNPDNDPAAGLSGEKHQRGVQVKNNSQALVQVTFHTDHPFWESFAHDTPAHFDPLAALAKKQSDGTYRVTLDDTIGVNPTAFKGPDGLPLPWRACQPGYTPPNLNAQMGFDTLSVPVNAAGSPATSIRDYNDYLKYDQSTQGHLNSDGLCYVQRRYPSPP